MDGTLALGQTLKTAFNNILTVKDFIAEVCEGEIYKVDYNGTEKTLKWYKKSFLDSLDNKFYDNLNRTTRNREPSDKFLWPRDISDLWNDSFGYVMDSIPAGYCNMQNLTLGKLEFRSYRTRVDTCLNIVDAFRELHNMGYSYQDLNDSSFWINPEKGKVLISDNDKVAQDGEELGILGKPRFLAPEVVLGKTKPNTQTDLFSMAIILYIILCYNHPLEGIRYLEPALSAELQEKIYGSEAYFMMDLDPKNPNVPSPKVHKKSIDIWKRFPNYIKQLFLNVFDQDSIKNPSYRPFEVEWLKALTRFRSEIVDCSCGNEVFTKNGESCKCELCGKKIQVPFKLVLRGYAIPAIKNSRIYRCQLGVDENNAVAPVASIVPTKDTGELHIWNKTKDTWKAKTPSGKSKDVAPESKIPLKDGIIFTVNGQEIKIEANKN